MIEPLSERHIKEAMFSIHSVKSPSPDGYSSSFFKAGWADIGPKVCKAIQEFFGPDRQDVETMECNKAYTAA